MPGAGAARTPPFTAPGRAAVDVRYLRRPDVGIGVYLRFLLGELRRAGWSLTLLTDDAAHAERLAADDRAAEVVHLPLRSGFLYEQIGIWRHLQREQPQLYVAPANWGVPLLYSGPTALVVVVHDLIPLTMPTEHLVPDLGWALKYVVSTGISALRADWVLTNSAATAEEVRRLWCRRRVRTVYPSTALSVEGAEPAEVPIPGPPARNSYFAYTGGDGARKNLPALFEAMAQLRAAGDTRWLRVSGSAGAAIAAQAARAGLEAVEATGVLSEEQLATFVRGADALVYPSVREGLGLPVLEALAAGTPAVCARLPAIVELAGGLPHYADVSSPTAIAAALREAGTCEAREQLRRSLPSQRARVRALVAENTLAAALEEALLTPGRRRRAPRRRAPRRHLRPGWGGECRCGGC